MENKSLRDLILDYINILDGSDYPNVKNMIKNDAGKNRVIDIIQDRVISGKKIEPVVDELEISLYE
jgi:hypothetical protein